MMLPVALPAPAAEFAELVAARYSSKSAPVGA
jgi:hypothetical protein